YEFEIDESGKFVREEPTMVEGSNLGLLRDEDLNVLSRGAEPTVLTGHSYAFLQSPEPLIVAKSTMVSRIHRKAHADYVGVKHYDAAGRISGETRFLGLFTAEAYDETARSVPLIRKRVAEVRERIGAGRRGHTANALSNILETWPRDELFQTDVETLATMAKAVLHLIERPRPRLFVRRDQFDRFVTAIIYVPRDAYDSDLRQRMGSVLEETYDATLLTFEPRFGNERLARVFFVLALNPGHPEPDLAALEQKIVSLAARWQDAFRDALAETDLQEYARDGALCFKDAFNAAYREAFRPDEALLDVAELAELTPDQPIRLRTYRQPTDDKGFVRAKVYSRGQSIPLSESVPVFENMGLFVDFETGYKVRPSERPRADAPDMYWIHDVSMRTQSGAPVDLEHIGQLFADAFAAVWLGQTQNDGFNRLVFTAGATWQEANLLRGLSAYRRQSGLDPAEASQVRAFTQNTDITKNLLELFRTLFDPTTDDSLKVRTAAAKLIRSRIREQLGDVQSLEDDRVLRRTCNLIMAIKRTNYYQTNDQTLAFKIASSELEELPKPKPYREIFVTSPVVDGVHLRFGAVARGGLRWSDRPDDFRTEVLGLVKAQQVKNAVIVPVGSKGGFYPKQLPLGGSREAVRQAGIHAYKTFIAALLDLTDNLIDGDVQHPENTIIHDEADPYLVVAADKGTATFSDIANEISVCQGFWLGDAFASGGSAGYDHKAMGITARGGWEAVKRHFFEMGKDIQDEPFTVVGIGDMSGDVFGNGMLLSKQIRLVAAFNHLHVFVDPNPGDPERLWAERKRLFDLPRSGWGDYDQSLISEGGGIFERSAKSVPLNDELRALTGLSGEGATPDQLIHALLKTDVELLWFGGIGTYVK
ncbi:MAG: NAD-glutamate dehydrogenase domain-containing protein, partial [Pseudomonadota bacterium]